MVVHRAAAAAPPAHRAGRTARARPVLPVDLQYGDRLDYYRVLQRFMRWRDNVDYPPTKVFTQEELLTITPQELKRWIIISVYGKEDPTPEDNPTLARSGTVLTWKKAISYWMPNKGSGWLVDPSDPSIGFGNPTKSPVLNSVIKAIVQKETRNLAQGQWHFYGTNIRMVLVETKQRDYLLDPKGVVKTSTNTTDAT